MNKSQGDIPTHLMSWQQWILRHPKRVIVITLAACLILALGALNLKFSHDYRAFFDQQNPELQAHEALEATFMQSDSVNFFLHAETGDFFTPERLAIIEELTAAAWQIPHVIRVDSLTNYQHSMAEGDDLIVMPLFENGTPNLALDDIRAIAKRESAIAGRLIGADGQTVQIIATTQLPASRDELLPTIAKAVKALRRDIERQHPDIKVAITGVVMLSYSFFDITQQDMMLLFPIMIVFLGVLMGLLFRSFRLSLSALIVMVLSIGATMGLAGWTGVKLTPASGQAPIIILTVAIADSIHLIVGVRKYLLKGYEKVSAIGEALRVNAQPIMLTSLTTALGFLSLNFSDTPPFRDLGNIAAVGTIAAFLVSITLLPALLSLLRIEGGSESRTVERLESRLIDGVIAHHKKVLAASLLILFGLIALIPNLRINDNFVGWISKGETFRDDADFINAQLPGIYAIQFAIDSGEDGGIADPAYLRDLSRFAEHVRGREEVAHVLSFDRIMRRLNRNMHGDDPAYNTLPQDRELAAQYLLLYELSLPQGLDLNNQIDIAKSQTRMVAMLYNVSSERMKEFKAEAEAWARANLTHANVLPATGTNIVFAHLTESNMRSMFIGTLIAFTLIAVTLGVTLRSWKFGLLSLLPNLAPALATFGLWSIFHAEIGLYAAFVTATSLGLIVDFTVHLFSKYLRARREGNQTPEDAIRYVFASTGMALWVSALVLIVGFLVLTFSNFAIIALMAAMVAMAIFVGLVADFTMTPALILAFAKRD